MSQTPIPIASAPPSRFTFGKQLLHIDQGCGAKPAFVDDTEALSCAKLGRRVRGLSSAALPTARCITAAVPPCQDRGLVLDQIDHKRPYTEAMGKTMPSNAFLRFVNLMRAISVLPAGISLDPQEERLMHELAVHWGRGDSVTVLAAMRMLADASPSTVQRRLKTLRSKGLLMFETAAHDARVRYVVATDQGQAYFMRLGEVMQQAVGRR